MEKWIVQTELENDVYEVEKDSLVKFAEACQLLKENTSDSALCFSFVDYITNRAVDFSKYKVILFESYLEYSKHFDKLLNELGKQSVIVLDTSRECKLAQISIDSNTIMIEKMGLT